jgi:phosphatidylglycerol:prolipoprotein diacylglycerol transferase
MHALAGSATGIASVFAYIVINIDPVLFRLGPIAVHWYGIMYVMAITIGLWVILRYTRMLGLHEDQVWSIFVWTAVAGLIGGRLYYVVQQEDLYQRYILHPINIIAVWDGGMAFFGAIFLGTSTLFFLARRYGISPWLAIDGGALFAAVGQIFGRFGNIINGDIVGYAFTNGPINVPGDTCAHAPCVAVVDSAHVPWYATVYLNPNSFHAQGVPYHPAAAYEIGLNLIMLAVLWQLRYILPRIRAGYFFILYLVMYAFSQIIVFFVRDNVITPFLGITIFKQAQWTAIFVLLFAVPTLIALVRRYSEPWRYSIVRPVPWPPNADATSAEQDTPSPQPASGPNASANPGVSLATAAETDVAQLPPWQPVRPVGGQLRNMFGPTRTSQGTT